MTADERRKVDRLFAESQPLSAADRATFLDHSCPDALVRREVECLLNHSSPEGGDPGEPAAQTTVSRAGSQPTSAPRRDLIGHTLGPYRVISLIGEGGMGEIYAAEDPRLGRQVALKLLLPSVTEDGDAFRRFQQEARAASALNHPNIVTVHDFGSGDGVYYIATELVQGRTLRQVMEQDQSPVREILATALQIAGALAVAHAAGIIHRDIKPENVMLRPDGYVKIVDFGLAKLIKPDASPERDLTVPRAR